MALKLADTVTRACGPAVPSRPKLTARGNRLPSHLASAAARSTTSLRMFLQQSCCRETLRSPYCGCVRTSGVRNPSRFQGSIRSVCIDGPLSLCRCSKAGLTTCSKFRVRDFRSATESCILAAALRREPKSQRWNDAVARSHWFRDRGQCVDDRLASEFSTIRAVSVTLAEEFSCVRVEHHLGQGLKDVQRCAWDLPGSRALPHAHDRSLHPTFRKKVADGVPSNGSIKVWELRQGGDAWLRPVSGSRPLAVGRCGRTRP